jgi:hypothetical protein
MIALTRAGIPALAAYDARMGPVRQLIVVAFAIIQAILGARILLDLGVLPADMPFVGFIEPASDALAAPVVALAERFGTESPGFGSGLDPAIVTALIGWSVIEVVVLMVVGRR